MQDDIDGIYDTLKQTAKISQSGGIGLSIHNVSYRIVYSWNKRNFKRNCSMLRVFNDTARYVDQGGGKRKGSFAIYIETWHADILISRLEKNTGKKKCVQVCFFCYVDFRFIYETCSGR
jgi:ribonucleoside-diphosphate reductase alpha chain